MKNEIPSDHAAPDARSPPDGPRAPHPTLGRRVPARGRRISACAQPSQSPRATLVNSIATQPVLGPWAQERNCPNGSRLLRSPYATLASGRRQIPNCTRPAPGSDSVRRGRWTCGTASPFLTRLIATRAVAGPRVHRRPGDSVSGPARVPCLPCVPRVTCMPRGHLGAELLYAVLEQRRRDGRAVRLAAQEREREVLRLVVLDLAWQRRLVRVHVHVEQRRARVVER